MLICKMVGLICPAGKKWEGGGKDGVQGRGWADRRVLWGERHRVSKFRPRPCLEAPVGPASL